MSDEAQPVKVHETMDAQSIRYWDREAARLDGLAKTAIFKWMARGYARKADRARALAAQSRAREAARGRSVESA